MFKKYADESRSDGSSTISMKSIQLEKKYGKKFPDLVSIFFVWTDTNNDGSIGFEEFRSRIEHLLFLQKCPTSREKHLSKYFRVKK